MRHKPPRLLRILRVRQRRLGAWIDRRTGHWLPFIPSWGASLLCHSLVFLMLGLYLYAQGGRDRGDVIQGRFATQLTEDLTSLGESDHAGDPFTTIKTNEPPSLSLTPADPEVTAINQPELPSLSKFAPDLSGPEMGPAPSRLAATGTGPARRLAPDVSAKALGAVVTRLHTEDMIAPFSGRDAANRAKLVRREGGTVHSEKAVEDGIDWIVRHQRGDGGWSLNFQGQCQGHGCAPQTAMESDAAATGLGLLPLLGAGHIHTQKSRYQANVRQGLGWLVGRQQETGDLYVGAPGMAHMYSHAIATMALCEAYGISLDPALRRPAQRAIDFIVASQNPDSGGWRYQPGQVGDTSVFGWQMFALRSARLGGLRVPRCALKGCRAYLDSVAADSKKVTYAYMAGRHASPVMTAEALLSRQYLGWPRDFPPLVKGASMVARDLQSSRDRNIYYWYYATQLLHNMQTKDWERWNVRVRDGLVSLQMTGDDCARGSWDPVSPRPDAWASSSGGRLFLTSLSVLTLEVYYRYLPLYQPSEGDAVKLDGDVDAAKKDEAATGP